VYLLFKNLDFLGSGYGYAKILGPIDAVVFALGVAGAFYLKARNPTKYDAVGRLVNQGV
jgi:hypothetical protein